MSISGLYSSAGIVGGRIAKNRSESYDNRESTKAKDTIGLLQAAGTAALVAPFMSKMTQGALYSAGAEPIVGQHGFGFAYMQKELFNKGLAKDLPFGQRAAIVSGPKGLFLPHGGGTGGFRPVHSLSSGLLDTHAAGLGSKLGQGVMRQGLINSILPIGMTAWFAADAYASDGMTGLGKYLVADVLGNYYGTEAGLFSAIVKESEVGAAKASIARLSGASETTVAATAEGGIVAGGGFQRINPILRSGMIGRMAPILGGIMGATVGMELGATAGSAASSMIGYNANDTISTITGGFIGALGGAKFGAYALSSIARLGVVGLGVLATKSIVSNTMGALQSGFENINKNRGLNYAGDTAAYFTQNAVTMRERAMQSIHKSHLNARSAFGQEASLMHMNRDMFSQYKRAL